MTLTEAPLGQLVIIEPLGPQGPKLGLGVSSAEEMKTFNESVGALPESERKDPIILAHLAEEAGMVVVKP